MATTSCCSTLRTAVIRRSTLVATSQRPSFKVYPATHNAFSSSSMTTFPGLTELRGDQFATAPMATGPKRDWTGSRNAPRAALAESPTEGKLPESSSDPVTLDKNTLRLALDAALLSSLAYKSPVQVEYLRLRAQTKVKMSQEEALEAIKKQAGGTLLGDLAPANVAELEEENTRLGYTEILSGFAEPSQYFDGKQSLFMKATVAYLFFCPTPDGQRNIIYVVFRGTEGHADILADIQLTQVEIRPGDESSTVYKGLEKQKVMLHLGFRDQFVAVSTALTRNVEAAAREVAHSSSHPPNSGRLTDMFKAKIKDPSLQGDSGVRVVVAGHSLGAALATIGSFVSCLDHPDIPCSFFGFGSPRVGNATFAEVYKRVSNGHVIHFANKDDPVTGVPIPPQYAHVLGGHMLDEVNKQVVVTPLADELGHSLQSVGRWVGGNINFLGWAISKFGKGALSRHDIDLYVKRVRALYEKAKEEK